jgi:hypothetical protein
MEHIYWKPAVEKMLDFVAGHPQNSTMSEVTAVDADRFIPEIKGRSIQLYSMLSKGVHWEYFTSALVFDESTVKDAIRETCLIISQLGLASHFIPTAYASLLPEKAVAEYITFRKLMS